jgi:hypothetical protein
VKSAIRQMLGGAIKGDAHFVAYIGFCEQVGLDPRAREVYGWTDSGGKLVIAVGIQGYKKLAERRSRILAEEIAHCGPDGVWRNPWVSPALPIATRCRIWLANNPRPTEAVIYYEEFKVDSNPNWKQRPLHMLTVRARAHAYRAVPGALDGVDLSGADLTFHEEGAVIPGTSRIVEEQPAPLAAPAEPSFADLPRAEQWTVMAREYRKVGGNPDDKPALLRHLCDALGREIRSFGAVTVDEKAEFVALLQERGCLPGADEWLLEAQLESEEDQFAGDDPGADHGNGSLPL